MEVFVWQLTTPFLIIVMKKVHFLRKGHTSHNYEIKLEIFELCSISTITETFILKNIVAFLFCYY